MPINLEGEKSLEQLYKFYHQFSEKVNFLIVMCENLRRGVLGDPRIRMMRKFSSEELKHEIQGFEVAQSCQ